MPPRYVYWTILIDNAPTAFRAAEREDLLPTLHQLQRKNANVVLKWFARGRLWDSPEAERDAQSVPRATEKRNREWRPGGQHQDPRARFDKEARRRKKREDRVEQPSRPRTAGGAPPDFNPRAPRKPWESRPPRDRAPGGGDRKPWERKPTGDRPWSAKPPGGARKPWSGKPGGGDAKRPWSDKPSGGAKKPWSDRPRSAGGQGSSKPWENRPPRDRAPGGNERKPWRKKPDDRPWRQNEPRKRPDDSPDTPPPSEQIVTKPKPPERG